MKTILVTGGAGFVGRACKALSHAGYLPVTFDNVERGHEWAVKWGPLERGDLRNSDDLKRPFVLRTCAAFGCENVVFSSSCATYDVPERLPITEATTQNTVDP